MSDNKQYPFENTLTFEGIAAGKIESLITLLKRNYEFIMQESVKGFVGREKISEREARIDVIHGILTFVERLNCADDYYLRKVYDRLLNTK